MNVSVKAESVEYLYVPLTASAGEQTITSAQVAVLEEGRPDVSDWVNAELLGGSIRFLFGVDDLDLRRGTYVVWVRLVGDPESVVESVGTLVVG